MPLESCPLDEKTLAEYSLGRKRSRLNPEEFARVEAHVATCEVCKNDVAFYREREEKSQMKKFNPDASPELLESAQNVATRFVARISDNANAKARIDVGRKWKRRAALLAAAAAVFTAVLFFVFDPPEPPPIVVITPPPPPPPLPPGVSADDLTEEELTAARADAGRAHAAMETLQNEIHGMAPEDALARLAKARSESAAESPVYAETVNQRLLQLYEQLLFRTRGKPGENDVVRELSRAYLAAGERAKWMQTFQAYAGKLGDAAQQAALGQKKSAAEAARAAYEAKAQAMFDETMRLYQAKDHATAIQMSDRLMAQYPQSAKAWEGLTVAARAYLANGQPSGSIASYQKILDDCPDERFAREAGRALLRMYLYADRLDDAVAEAKGLRERFVDGDFLAFSLYIEGMAYERQGEAYYPNALTAYQEVLKVRPDSQWATESNERMGHIRQDFMKEFDLKKEPLGDL